MNNFLIYLLELNTVFLILYGGYRLLFNRDRNFVSRRFFLLGILGIPFILPLLPDMVRIAVQGIPTVSFRLEELTIYGEMAGEITSRSLAPSDLLMGLYLVVLAAGMIRLGLQLWGIFRAAHHAERLELGGSRLIARPALHASSFFGFIFIDPDSAGQESFQHILEHEKVHQREWHSIDRLLAEFFVLINWFNPVAWMLRRSVIENLEFLADSAVVEKGTDSVNYQLSILNQYIGSASITNQFSHQIKNRINMLNKNYKPGSCWKLILAFPLVCIALVAISCADRGTEIQAESVLKGADSDNRIYYQVDEMPTFRGEEPIMSFRKYIAQNIMYPEEAKAKNVTGKVFIHFVVRKDGTIEIPAVEEVAAAEGIPLDEVVVVAYRTLDENDPVPDDVYIDLLKKETIRVVTSSPKWEPGKVDGEPVNVGFTFPINFVLQ